MGDRNIISAFFKKAEERNGEICFHYKYTGVWKTLNWDEVADLVHQYARGLTMLGVGRGTPVALLSSTRMEWTLLDFAILTAGGICVPVYPNLPQEHIDFILKDSGCRTVIVENDELHRRLRESIRSCFECDHIIMMQGTATSEDVMSLRALIECGHACPVERVDHAWKETNAEDPASYIYTSGTTGVQKGAVLTHGNLISEIDAAMKIFQFEPHEVCLVCLPQAHVLGRLAEFYLMLKGCQSAFAESFDKLAENYREVRPHFVVGVPRMLEKAYERVHALVKRQPFRLQRLFNWAKETGIHVAELKEQRKNIGVWVGFKYFVAKCLVFRKLKARLGGRLYCFVSGGAPLNKEVAAFFSAAGIQVLEGYGLTETFAAIAVNRFEDYRFGTVGKPLDGVEMKLDNDGEIMVRGPMVFKGYLNRPEATAEALQDGWFRTGDIGEFTGDGFLRITDRKKDIIITAGGKNIAPQRIEGIMAESPYINHVMVCGDKRKFLTALVTLNFEEVGRFAQREGIMYSDTRELAQNPVIHALIDRVIAEKNQSLASFETIKRFAVLPDDFSPETGEITPTMKIRRRHVLEKYRNIVESLYRDA